MPHKFGFVTRRDKNNKSGLDYTKSVIVETKSIPTYLIAVTGISFAEYQKIKKNQDFLFNTFIPISEKEYEERDFIEKRMYDFSSLQYFDHVLKKLKWKELLRTLYRPPKVRPENLIFGDFFMEKRV